MKEYRFQLVRLWRMRVLLLLIVFAAVYSAMHFFQNVRAEGQVAQNFSYEYFQTISNQIQEEKPALRIPPKLPDEYTDIELQQNALLRLDKSLHLAARAIRDKDYFAANAHLYALYHDYENHYVTDFIKNEREEVKARYTSAYDLMERTLEKVLTMGIPYIDPLIEDSEARSEYARFRLQIVHFDGADQLRMRMYQEAYEKGLPYVDPEVATNGAHSAEIATRKLIGMPFIILVVTLGAIIFIKDETDERHAFLSVQPRKAMKRYAGEMAAALSCVALSYLMIVLVSYFLGSIVAGDSGAWNYPVAVSRGLFKEPELFTLANVVLERFVRILPLSAFVFGTMLCLRAFLKANKLTVISAFGIAIGFQALALFQSIGALHQTTGTAYLNQLNPFILPMTANWTTDLRLPTVVVVVFACLLMALSIIISSQMIYLPKFLAFRRAKNVQRAIDRYPKSYTHFLPTVQFAFKKLIRNPYISSSLLLALGIIIYSAFQVQGHVNRTRENFLQAMRTQQELELKEADYLAPPRNVAARNRAEHIEEQLKIMETDPNAAIVALERMSMENNLMMLEGGFGYTMHTLTIHRLLFEEIVRQDKPVALTFASGFLPITLFDAPRTASELERHARLSQTHLNDRAYWTMQGFQQFLIPGIAVLLVLVLGTGMAQEFDGKRTIYFLQTQPVSPGKMYLAHLFTQGIIAILALIVVIGAGQGVLAMRGATNYRDYPTLQYVHDGEQDGVYPVPVSDLTLSIESPEEQDMRSTQTVGYTFQDVGTMNKWMIVLMLLLLLLCITFAGVISPMLRQPWAVSVCSIGIFILGTLALRYLKIQEGWMLPFVWVDVFSIARGDSAILFDQAHYVPQQGVLVLAAWIVLSLIFGVLVYRRQVNKYN